MLRANQLCQGIRVLFSDRKQRRRPSHLQRRTYRSIRVVESTERRLMLSAVGFGDDAHGPAGVDVELGRFTAAEIEALEAIEPNSALSTKTIKTGLGASEDGGHEPDVLTIVLDFKEPGQGNTTDVFGNVISSFDVTAYGFSSSQFNAVANAVLDVIDIDYFDELVGTVAGPAGQDLAVDFVIGDIGTPPPNATEYYYVQIGSGVSGPHTNGTLGVAVGSGVRNDSGNGPNFGLSTGDIMSSVFTDAIQGLSNLSPSNALTSGNIEFTKNAIAGTTSHEVGHLFSLSHINKQGSTQPTPGVPPIMGTGAIDLPSQDRIGNREFSLSGVDGQNGSAQRMHIAQLRDAVGLHNSGGGSGGGDNNDQISEAQALMTGTLNGSIGDATDVDMFSFNVTGTTTIGFDIDRRNGSTLDSGLRIFDSAGTELAMNDDSLSPVETNPPTSFLESYVQHTFTTAGTYYVGVSAYPNFSYDPVTGAGDAIANTSDIGEYQLLLNIAPRISSVAANQTYVRNTGFKSLFSNATLNDPDYSTRSGGKLRFIVTATNRQSGDELRIRTSNVLTRTGNALRVNGTIVGTITNESEFLIDVDVRSTAARGDVLRLIRALEFKTTSTGPNRTVRARFEDGAGEAGFKDVNVNVSNPQPPEIEGVADSITYRRNTNATRLFTGAQATDSDSANFNGGLFRTIILPTNRTLQDSIFIGTTSRVTKTGLTIRVDGVGVGILEVATDSRLDLRMNANATPSRISAVLGAIRFRTTVVGSPRTVRQIIEDNTGGSDTEQITVNVINSPVPPQINGAPRVRITAPQQTVTVGNAARLIDTDSSNYNTGIFRLHLLAEGRKSGDAVSIVPGNGVTITGNSIRLSGTIVGTRVVNNSNTIEIRFNNNANPNVVSLVMRQARFTPGASTGIRNVRLIVIDPDSLQNIAQVRVNVQSASDSQDSTGIVPSVTLSDSQSLFDIEEESGILETVTSSAPPLTDDSADVFADKFRNWIDAL